MGEWSARATLLATLVLAPALGWTGSRAPGAPGERPTWTNGNKQGLGTSAGPESRVWFTLGDGALTEVYYPTLDAPNTRLLELVVVAPDGSVERETQDTEHGVAVPDPQALLFTQSNVSRSGRFRIVKSTITDPRRPVVLQQVRFEPLLPGLRLFVFFDPALANSGMGDEGRAERDALLAQEGRVATALVAQPRFRAVTSGYLGSSDGLTELRSGRPLPAYVHSGRGNVAQIAELSLPASGPATLTLALGFGSKMNAAQREARASLMRPYEDVRRDYAAGWAQYLAPLRRLQGPHAHTFAMAAMVLKAHEDKTHAGAMVASLTKPWGDDADASAAGVGGYHLVWSRDLYHVATAFQLLGDSGAAGRALDYLFRVQQRPDGSFPQNTWLDGRPYWPSLQLDEVAYPLVMAQEQGRTDARTWRRHIRPAAEFILKHGPATPQERWEEEGGYSPAAIAAQIAGLVCAAAVAERNGDADAASRYRATADEWADRVESWTVTRSGPHAREPYFLRLSQGGAPDSGQALEINNGGGSFDERSIVDAGFLELVRLGIRPPADPLVARSLAVVDRTIRVETPHGPAWYRYNHDGYGEKPDGRGYDKTGVGRLWPLLTGERGEYELANGRDARPYLDAMAGFANDGRMLPEQVWDRPEPPRPHLRFGEGTGAATPLAWTSAGFIRLALGIAEGRLLGQPKVVADHFEKRRARAASR